MRNQFLKITGLLLMLSGAEKALATPTIEILALFSGRAMLLIDQQQHLLKAGDVSPEGVTLISATGKQAVVEYEGKQYTVEPTTVIHGEYKAAAMTDKVIPTKAKNTNAEVIINSDINNQYLTQAEINGHSVKAIVDTGANTVAIGTEFAKTLGLDYVNSGMTGAGQTAGGVTIMHLVKLDSVKVGDIEVHDVEASVVEGDFPDMILLGMTFLNQVHLSQEKGMMKLTQKNEDADKKAADTTSK